MTGITIGGLGVGGQDITGLAIGGYCKAQGKFTGLSIGVLNRARRLNGVQIGLLNYCRNNPPPFRLLPIINIHLGDDHPERRHRD